MHPYLWSWWSKNHTLFWAFPWETLFSDLLRSEPRFEKGTLFWDFSDTHVNTYYRESGPPGARNVSQLTPYVSNSPNTGFPYHYPMLIKIVILIQMLIISNQEPVAGSMKMPERRRPTRVLPSLSVFLPKRLSIIDCIYAFHVLLSIILSRKRNLTSHYNVTWLHMTLQLKWNFQNHVFQPSDLDIWPITRPLIILWDNVRVNFCAKYWIHTSIGSSVKALTNRWTHTQTLSPQPLTLNWMIDMPWRCRQIKSAFSNFQFRHPKF